MGIKLKGNISDKLIFSKIIGESSVESMASAVATDVKGNIYILINEVTLKDQYKPLGYLRVVKLNSDGDFQREYELTDKNSECVIPKGTAITVDDEENIYVTGFIFSLAEPSTILPIIPKEKAIQKEAHGISGYDPFVMKIDKDGSIIFSTYFGEKEDNCHVSGLTTESYGIAVDSKKNIWLTGATNSKRFFVTDDAYKKTPGQSICKIFLTKINAEGTAILYSTYFGGNLEDIAYGITVDKDDNVYIVGEADCDLLNGRTDQRGGFPTKNAYQKTIPRTADSCGFVSKFKSTGELEYSTYIGGKTGENLVHDIVVDDEGNAYISGMTGGGFPTKNGYKMDSDNLDNYYTGFIAKLNANGNKLLASTYIGGDNDYMANVYEIGQMRKCEKMFEIALFSLIKTSNLVGICKTIALDENGDVYITGETISKKYPITDNAYQSKKSGESDCVISKFNGCLNELLYSTYIGGAKNDASNKIVVNKGGKAIIVGETKSSRFPLTEDSSICKNGSAFALKLEVDNVVVPDDNKNKIARFERFVLTTGPVGGYGCNKEVRIVIENTTQEDNTIYVSVGELINNRPFRIWTNDVTVFGNSSKMISEEINCKDYEISFSNMWAGIYVSVYVYYLDEYNKVITVNNFTNEKMIKLMRN